MQEIIDIIAKEIDELDKIIKMVDTRNTYYYKEKMEYLRSVFPATYELNNQKEILQKQLDFYKDCQNAGIDFEKKYFLMNNIYLGFYARENSIYVGFYIDDDEWLYNHFMDSHSELNSWITKQIVALFDEYLSCADVYFDTESPSRLMNIIEGTNASISERVNAVKNIIEYTNPNGVNADAIAYVVDALTHKFDTMKKIAVDY